MELSTIVEIVEVYQPCHFSIQSNPYLQQQKLLKHTSRIREPLYIPGSTIVEIIKAYQPSHSMRYHRQKSTIVEIIKAYQPFEITANIRDDLQQQKLLKHTSQSNEYKQLLESTIVEIIKAYQPSLCAPSVARYLQQQKLLKHTSPWSPFTVFK